MAATATDVMRPADDGREETQLERLDRNTNELVQEMRVAAVGIQVLLAFLLVVPFQTGWKVVTSFDRYEYFVTLVSIAIAAALLIAPSIHHRILFRGHEKAYVVDVGNRLVPPTHLRGQSEPQNAPEDATPPRLWTPKHRRFRLDRRISVGNLSVRMPLKMRQGGS